MDDLDPVSNRSRKAEITGRTGLDREVLDRRARIEMESREERS